MTALHPNVSEPRPITWTATELSSLPHVHRELTRPRVDVGLTVAGGVVLVTMGPRTFRHELRLPTGLVMYVIDGRLVLGTPRTGTLPPVVAVMSPLAWGKGLAYDVLVTTTPAQGGGSWRHTAFRDPQAIADTLADLARLAAWPDVHAWAPEEVAKLQAAHILLACSALGDASAARNRLTRSELLAQEPVRRALAEPPPSARLHVRLDGDHLILHEDQPWDLADGTRLSVPGRLHSSRDLVVPEGYEAHVLDARLIVLADSQRGVVSLFEPSLSADGRVEYRSVLATAGAPKLF
jgi:hypothetical protein